LDKGGLGMDDGGFSVFEETMQTQGMFITFEGGEGAGKSTQIGLLAESLRAEGCPVEILREPGGTAAGERMRALLQHEEAGQKLVAEAELLLFAASRAQLVRERIRPALAAGTFVICDRFLDSTTVYQGVGRALPSEQVAMINAFAVGETRPEVTFLLDLPVEVARERMLSQGREADRIEKEPLDFHEAVRAGYLALAAAEPDRVFRVDATQSEEEIADAIRAALSERRHGLFS
jgi:dTMP kinase